MGRSHDYQLGFRIPGDELPAQIMIGATEGPLIGIVDISKGRIAMTEVIGAAKDHNHIRVRDHRIHPGGKIAVHFPLRHILLGRNAGAANAIAEALCSGALGDDAQNVL